jgi:hypothetical protein
MLVDGKQLKAGTVPMNRLAKDFLSAVLSSTFTVAGTTLADVTGMSWTLKAGTTYRFEFELQLSQATATGIVGLGVNYTGTLVQIAYSANIAAASATVAYRGTSTNNTALTDAAARAIGNSLPARVAGSITTTAAGVLSLRAQRSAGTTTILVGTSGRAYEV